jgi:ribosome maturation factor RimP
MTTTISTRIIGACSKTVVSEDNPLWDVQAVADGNNGALSIQVRGENGKTIRWVAHVQKIEVKT